MRLEDRAVVAICGADWRTFLQGLITNDINMLTCDRALYACMLNPQGKILFDFFLYEFAEGVYVDIAADKVDGFIKRLYMYKLRADVEFSRLENIVIYAAFGDDISKLRLGDIVINLPDARIAAMGNRLLVNANNTSCEFADKLAEMGEILPLAEYHKRRIRQGVADSADFVEDRSFVAQYGIEYLQGVSFSKGCYIGQEVVARGKSRGVLRKALYIVEVIDDTASFSASKGDIAQNYELAYLGSPVIADSKEVGQMRTHVGDVGLALLRIEQVERAISNNIAIYVGNAAVRPQLPAWFKLSDKLGGKAV